jgi:hypothetical protein
MLPYRRSPVLASMLTALTLFSACNVNGREALRPLPDEPALPSVVQGFAVTLESSGGALPTYTWRGGTFVEGRMGEAYAVRVTNPTPERVEVVVTVDGRDVVSGDEGDYERQRGYIVEPWGHLRIDGFRKSLSEVAQFRFTSPGDSYSSRRGTPQHVGVVGVAVFRERPRPIAAPAPIQPYYEHPEGARAESKAADDATAQRGRLGTQYGEQRYAPVTEVTFERRDASSPDALLALYYDDRDGLVSRGVLPPPYTQQPTAIAPQPFPRNDRFAPPPP